MRNKHKLLFLSFSLFLVACNDSNNQENTALQSAIELSIPDISSTLVEDFPVAIYVDYSGIGSGVGSIKRLDVNWPSIDVFPYSFEYGYIDGSDEQLTYNLLDNVPEEIDQAYDVERQDDSYWFVDGDNTLKQFDQNLSLPTEWQFSENMRFTSIAIDQEDTTNIWLYDSEAHQLVHFNSKIESTKQYSLPSSTDIVGLSISGSNLLMLGQQSNDIYIVVQYEAQGAELTPVITWQIEGFDSSEFVDVSMIPNGDIVVVTSDIENNIFLIADKSAFIGDGPIEDSGELTLVKQEPLPSEIKQPSGLWSMNDDRWLVVTDQGELFVLTEDFQFLDRVNLTFNSIDCNQGCVEAVTSDGNEFFVMTDSGVIASFSQKEQQYGITQEFLISLANDDNIAYQYAGLGYSAETGEYYLVSDQNSDEEDVLIILNTDFTLKDKYTITYGSEVEGSIYEYDAQGVQYHDGYLYVLSQQFTKLLKMDLTGEIIASYDIDNEIVTEPSDFVFRDEHIYIIGDHENGDPVPPVAIFTLQEY